MVFLPMAGYTLSTLFLGLPYQITLFLNNYRLLKMITDTIEYYLFMLIQARGGYVVCGCVIGLVGEGGVYIWTKAFSLVPILDNLVYTTHLLFP